MTVHIGTSGWSYDHWERVLYPHSLPQRERLGVYIQHFQTVEVNRRFYHWQRDATLSNWGRLVPDDILNSLPNAFRHVKISRSIARLTLP